MKQKYFYLIIFIGLLTSCTFEKNPIESVELSDSELFNLISTANIFYKDSTKLLSPNGNSPHGNFKIRFNSIANSVLFPSDKKLPKGKTFPDGSLIVKELFSGGGSPALYALMYKSSKDKNNTGNWLWSEIKPDQSVVVSVKTKGSSCVSCHSQGEGLSRDLTRIFEF